MFWSSLRSGGRILSEVRAYAPSGLIMTIGERDKRAGVLNAACPCATGLDNRTLGEALLHASILFRESLNFVWVPMGPSAPSSPLIGQRRISARLLRMLEFQGVLAVRSQKSTET